jgi:four helix bundle protein
MPFNLLRSGIMTGNSLFLIRKWKTPFHSPASATHMNRKPRSETPRSKSVRQTITYRDLDVWHRGNELVRMIFNITGDTQTYYMGKSGNTASASSGTYKELMSAIRESALAIPISIAQGQAVGSDSHFVYQLEKARAFSVQVDTQIIIAQQMDYIGYEDRRKIEVLIKEILSHLTQLIREILQSASE